MTAAEFLQWTRDHATAGNAADEAAVAFAEGLAGAAADAEAHAGWPFPAPNCAAEFDEWTCTRRPGHAGQHVASDGTHICHRWVR